MEATAVDLSAAMAAHGAKIATENDVALDYRVGDVHEYAKMSGAKGDVEYEGEALTANPKELFFSLHMDENHADWCARGDV